MEEKFKDVNKLIELANVLGVKFIRFSGLEALYGETLYLSSFFTAYFNHLLKNFDRIQKALEAVGEDLQYYIQLEWDLNKAKLSNPLRPKAPLITHLISNWENINFWFTGFLFTDFIHTLIGKIGKRFFLSDYKRTYKIKDSNENLIYPSTVAILSHLLSKSLPEDFDKMFLLDSKDFGHLQRIKASTPAFIENYEFFKINKQNLKYAINSLSKYMIANFDGNTRFTIDENPLEIMVKALNNSLNELVNVNFYDSMDEVEAKKKLNAGDAVGNFYGLILSDVIHLTLYDSKTGKRKGIISIPTSKFIDILFDENILLVDEKLKNSDINAQKLKNRILEIRNYVKQNNLDASHISVLMKELTFLNIVRKEYMQFIYNRRAYFDLPFFYDRRLEKEQANALLKSLVHFDAAKGDLGILNKTITPIINFLKSRGFGETTFRDEYFAVLRTLSRLNRRYVWNREKPLKDELNVVIDRLPGQESNKEKLYFYHFSTDTRANLYSGEKAKEQFEEMPQTTKNSLTEIKNRREYLDLYNKELVKARENSKHRFRLQTAIVTTTILNSLNWFYHYLKNEFIPIIPFINK